MESRKVITVNRHDHVNEKKRREEKRREEKRREEKRREEKRREESVDQPTRCKGQV